MAPLPPQVGGVSAFAQWLLERSDAIGHPYDAFDLEGAATGAGGEVSARALARQASLARRYVRWLRRDFVAMHYSVSLKPTGLARDVLFIGLARAFRKRVVAHIHNVSDLDRLSESLPLRIAVRLISRWSAAVVVIAFAAENRLREVGIESRCIYLPQRFDSPAVRKHEPTTRDLIVLFAGACGRAKGLDELIAAIAALRERGGRFRLVAVGGELKEGERARLEAVARNLGAADLVEFHPAVQSVALRDYYETSDIICLPSWREGFPMSLLEGMAFGLPPVATAVGGIPELIEKDVSGLLVEPGDVAGLVDALAMLDDFRERDRIGGAASQRTARHSDARTTEAWRSLYRDVLSSRPAASGAV